MTKRIMVSGGFDPIHKGHVRMILAAAEHGDVVVVANSDDWLMRKKGYVFMPWEERAEIISAIRGVTEVVTVDDSDNTVCEALIRCKPDAFANGGDRKGDRDGDLWLDAMDNCPSIRNRLQEDSDGDGVSDGSEVDAGTDPLDGGGSAPTDSDGDGDPDTLVSGCSTTLTEDDNDDYDPSAAPTPTSVCSIGSTGSFSSDSCTFTVASGDELTIDILNYIINFIFFWSWFDK